MRNHHEVVDMHPEGEEAEVVTVEMGEAMVLRIFYTNARGTHPSTEGEARTDARVFPGARGGRRKPGCD